MATILDYMLDFDAREAKNRMQNALIAAQRAKNPFIGPLMQAQVQEAQARVPYTQALTRAQQLKNPFIAALEQAQINQSQARVPLMQAQAQQLMQRVRNPLLGQPGVLGMLGAEKYERDKAAQNSSVNAQDASVNRAPLSIRLPAASPSPAGQSVAPSMGQSGASPVSQRAALPFGQPEGSPMVPSVGSPGLTDESIANFIAQSRSATQEKTKSQTDFYKNRAKQAGWSMLPEYQRDQVFANLNKLGYPNSVILGMFPQEAQQKIVNQIPYSGSDAIRHAAKDEEVFTRARLGNLMFDEPQRRQIRFAGEAKQTLNQVAPILADLAPKLAGLSNFGRASLTKAGLIGNTKDALAMNELKSRTGLLANEVLQQLGGHATNEQREEFSSLVNPVKAGLDGKTYIKYYKDLWDYLDTVDRNIIAKPVYSLIDMLTTKETNPFEGIELQQQSQRDPLGLGL